MSEAVFGKKNVCMQLKTAYMVGHSSFCDIASRFVQNSRDILQTRD